MTPRHPDGGLKRSAVLAAWAMATIAILGWLVNGTWKMAVMETAISTNTAAIEKMADTIEALAENRLDIRQLQSEIQSLRERLERHERREEAP